MTSRPSFWVGFFIAQKKAHPSTDNKKLSEAIFNVAQRRPEGWPPGMAGNKKPVSAYA